jgi:hypothetical protein
MREHPILFNDAMVRAILAGQKTQTRRVIKGAPCNKEAYLLGLHQPTMTWGIHRDVEDDGGVWKGQCPFGQPGDRLWVRETFCCVHGQPHLGGLPHPSDLVHFRADMNAAAVELSILKAWKPSIHMPRAYCRNLLDIAVVRIERLQDISEADAIAEGIEGGNRWLHGWRNYFIDTDAHGWTSPIDSFRSLWGSINGPASWSANPWVWVVEFKRVKP